MPDYKEMYLTMARASEEAMNILIETQRKCEEMYISEEKSPDAFLKVIKMERNENSEMLSTKNPCSARLWRSRGALLWPK